jgi:cation:H+ antiporter
MDSKTIIFLVLGLILLLASGKFLVESSVTIAKHFRIPTSIIGLTIVAFGTSAPELFVSLQAAVQGHPDMAVGNVIGSNISNILLVLGITTIIFPLAVHKSSILRDWPIMMGITILLALFLLDLRISRAEGIIMLLLLGSYLAFSVFQSKRINNESQIPDNKAIKNKWGIAVFIFLVSCVGLAIGADLLVKNASVLANNIGISERVISISMVALGTSLPELSTSIIAAFKKETDISIGNIIGSNIMNIISVLGFTSLIKPIDTVKEVINIDVPWMIGSTILLLLFMLPARKGRITRFEGSVMTVGYATYIYFIFMS